MRRIILACALFALTLAAGPAGAQPNAARSWAAPQIDAVVDSGSWGRASRLPAGRSPHWGEFATVLASLGVTCRPRSRPRSDDPRARPATRHRRRASPGRARDPTRRGRRGRACAEAVARHGDGRAHARPAREPPPGPGEARAPARQPATRAEAAYSLARVLTLTARRSTPCARRQRRSRCPRSTPWQQAVLRRGLRFVGSPYVWAGTSERPQQLCGRLLPGGFDCSGFVWRVFKLEPYAGGPGLGAMLGGGRRTT